MKNLYLHITDECDHNCVYCYNNGRRKNPKVMSIETVNKALTVFPYDQVTITGGEPTLSYLFDDTLKLISIEYPDMKIRVDSNGYDVNKIIKNKKHISEVRVSLDGDLAMYHDRIRGKPGSFAKCVNSITRLIDNGIKCEVTSTINRYNYGNVEDLIGFCEKLGVGKINFHIVTVYGYINDDRELGISAEQWLKLVSLFNNLDKNIDIVYPVGFAPVNTDFKCCIQNLDRISVFSGGEIYPCALYFGETSKLNIDDINSINDVDFGEMVCYGECTRLRSLSEQKIGKEYFTECIYTKKLI